MFSFTHLGDVRQGSLQLGTYPTGNLAVQLVADGEDYATLSVNMQDVTLAASEFLFKTYSENDGLLEAMIAAGTVVVIRIEDTAAGSLPVCQVVS